MKTRDNAFHKMRRGGSYDKIKSARASQTYFESKRGLVNEELTLIILTTFSLIRAALEQQNEECASFIYHLTSEIKHSLQDQISTQENKINASTPTHNPIFDVSNVYEQTNKRCRTET